MAQVASTGAAWGRGKQGQVPGSTAASTLSRASNGAKPSPTCVLKGLSDLSTTSNGSTWRLEWEDEIHFQLPYGQWIRLFRENGLLVEDLIEIQPPPEATSTYHAAAETQWARRWPMEHIWKLRKQADENR